MDSIRKLEEIFSRFPGIGPRQARRFVHYLISKPSSFIKEFTILLEEVKQSSAECISCHRFFFQKSAIKDSCPTCSDDSRDMRQLMIVARDSDFESVEKSGAYKGLYFILGGTVPILENDPEKKIRIKKLLEYILKSKSIQEIILSLNTTPDGENTANIVRRAINELKPNRLVKITVLGRGLSTGAELEYMDEETIKNALGNRKSA